VIAANASMTPKIQVASMISILHYHDVGGYGRFGLMRMRKVIHLGPVNSRGGMSAVIQSLVKHPPEHWFAEALATHADDSVIAMIGTWNSSRSELQLLAREGQIDLAHIHVTHSASWWRKRDLMRICEKNEIPTVIHIHSGRFDEFCSGLSGGSVRRNLCKRVRRTVVLEERWLSRLVNWIPPDSEVIPNPSESIVERKGHLPGGTLKLLMLSRGGRGKGLDFATKVLDSLLSTGVDATLRMSGEIPKGNRDTKGGRIEYLGWVSEKRKAELIAESDFLLMPSEFEGSSMAVIESIVNGLPCIVSPACAETVGMDSLVLGLEDPRVWAERVQGLSDSHCYAEVVDELSQQAKRFSIEVVRERWGAIYEGLMQEANASNDSH